MNRSKSSSSMGLVFVVRMLLIFAMAFVATAQNTLHVERGEVIAVSGNTVILKMENGEVRTFYPKADARVTVDGKDLGIADLKAGMKLQRTIVTTTTPETVSSVRSISGKVWHVNAPLSVILTLPSGENRQYKVPDGTVFLLDGQKKTIFELRKGMRVSATVVSTSEMLTSSTHTSRVSGTAEGVVKPVPVRIEAAHVSDPILVEEPTAAPVAESPSASSQSSSSASTASSSEPAPSRLPRTGSPLPMIGLAGLALTGAGLIARKFRG